MLNNLPAVKHFLRRPGGVDQYPAVHLEWKLHPPQLYAYDNRGKQLQQPIDLASYDAEGLHRLFSAHFTRVKVPPPSFGVRVWRRLFGWAYGIPTSEAALLFVCAGVLLLIVCYAFCFRYTAMCDYVQDI